MATALLTDSSRSDNVRLLNKTQKKTYHAIAQGDNTREKPTCVIGDNVAILKFH